MVLVAFTQTFLSKNLSKSVQKYCFFFPKNIDFSFQILSQNIGFLGVQNIDFFLWNIDFLGAQNIDFSPKKINIGYWFLALKTYEKILIPNPSKINI